MTMNIEHYGIIVFLIKYIICVFLMIDLVKRKRTKGLIRSVIGTFSGLSVIILINFILSLNGTKPDQVFYYINFVDFTSITLIINLFLSKEKEPE